MLMYRLSLALVLMLGVGVPAYAQENAASDAKIDYQPSSAAYRVTMISAQDSRIQSVDGGMVDTTEFACDGYHVRQQLILRIIPQQGGRDAIINTLGTTWESKDGLSFRFNQKTSVNGHAGEEVSGEAKMTAADGAGTARFSNLKDSVELPAGTVFPVGMAQRVVKAVGAGEDRFELLMFDGSSSGENGVSAVVGTIGAAVPMSAAAAKVGLPEGTTSWPVSLAYYTPGKADAAPYLQNGFKIMPNGAAETMFMEINGIRLRFDLDQYKALPKPTC